MGGGGRGSDAAGFKCVKLLQSDRKYWGGEEKIPPPKKKHPFIILITSGLISFFPHPCTEKGYLSFLKFYPSCCFSP